MSVQEKVIPFAPNKIDLESTRVIDESARNILALVERAADKAKDDCARAMDLAHKLTLQLRATEERVQKLEDEAVHFRDRANRAEDWLKHIHKEVEQTFFQTKQPQPRQTQK